MPSHLHGFLWRDWQRLSKQHLRGQPGTRHLLAWYVAVRALANSAIASFEPDAELTPELREIWQHPIFILGLPRSGTTYLQQLLATNAQLAYPRRFDCFNPWTFLTLQRLGIASLLGRLRPRSRTIDQVQIGWLSPEEDEFALTGLTADGPWINRAFPRSQPRPFATSHDDEIRERCWPWQDALQLFTRKLIWLNQRTLVLKSPLHTGRVRELLTLFPAARFVTILRDPREQFRSFIDVVKGTKTWGTLQTSPEVEDRWERIRRMADSQRVLLNSYFADRPKIPPSQLIEVTYEELIAEPRKHLKNIHEKLNIPGWKETAQQLSTKLNRQIYQRNPPRTLNDMERDLAIHIYHDLFRNGYYLEVLRELRSPAINPPNPRSKDSESL